ncbi:hypothetical protein LPJ64_005932 [Coemansia asiatica]|uniref:Uncharacterized protein n=1 Tax=Coemansia asiatica TaxID=1052880 RepID=A0A9W7XG97_9FUNG|nr:hypothetical protein LPJ64_005932 [Coemansia asiatica]
MNRNDGRFHMHSSSHSLSGTVNRVSMAASFETASTANTSEDSSSSSSGGSLDSAGCLLQLSKMHVNTYANQAIHAAAALVRQRFSRSDAALVLEKLLAVFGNATQKIPAEHAVDLIWQLGIELPESGLVPEDDSGRIRMLQFLYTWATRIVPVLHLQPSECPARTCDLAMLSSWIALQRRRHAKSKGPFWNGRMPSAAEIVVAPFADLVLHSNIIPDSQEFGSLAVWLAAIRALPQLADTLI